MGANERLVREMRSLLVGKVRSTNTTGSVSYLNVISKAAQVIRSVVHLNVISQSDQSGGVGKSIFSTFPSPVERKVETVIS